MREDNLLMPSILLVDDEQDHLWVLSAILRRIPAEITCFREGQEALQAVRTQPFHLALIDLRLPDMDGLRALEQIKRLQPDLPVVILTAYPSRSTAAEAHRRGAVAYLEKPFPPAQLRTFVQRLLAGELPPEAVSDPRPPAAAYL